MLRFPSGCPNLNHFEPNMQVPLKRFCSIISFIFHSLAFSVTMYCSEACVAVLVLVLRRRKSIGGELGGPKRIKIITSMFFFSLWLIYLTMSSLEAYDIIPGFWMSKFWTNHERASLKFYFSRIKVQFVMIHARGTSDFGVSVTTFLIAV